MLRTSKGRRFSPRRIRFKPSAEIAAKLAVVYAHDVLDARLQARGFLTECKRFRHLDRPREIEESVVFQVLLVPWLRVVHCRVSSLGLSFIVCHEFGRWLRTRVRHASISSSSTADARDWMNSNLGAGSRPISRSTKSLIGWRSSYWLGSVILIMDLVAGSMVVSLSWLGFISPRPLKRLTSTFLPLNSFASSSARWASSRAYSVLAPLVRR